MKTENKSRAIIINPWYQYGFEGFLKNAYDNGEHILIGGKLLDFGVDLKSYGKNLTKLFGRAFFWFPSPIFLLGYLRKNKIKHLHVMSEPTNLAMLSIAIVRLFYSDFTISCRIAQNVPVPILGPFKWSLSFFRRNGLIAFAVANESLKFAKQYYGLTRLTTLPNGIPDSFIGEPIRDISRDKILFVGSFFERKGFNEFIKLSQEIELQKFDFVAVGGGIPENSIKALNEKYSNIKFHDRVLMHELIRFYDSAKVVVMPSKYSKGGDLPGIRKLFPIPWKEQFGRVIIEAYSRGCEVLAYDSGGIPDIHYNKNLLIREGDYENLKKSLLKYVSEEITTKPKLINYSKDFAWSKIYKEYSEKIGNIL